MKRQLLFAITLLLLVVSAVGMTVVAETSVAVYVLDPTKAENGAKGVLSQGHWVGEIPVRLTLGTKTVQTLAYCMDPDGTLNTGTTYNAQLSDVTDNDQWKAISYLLTWNQPEDNKAGALNQVAIWKLLYSTFTPQSWLNGDLANSGIGLADEVYGRDVGRITDRFEWISPVTGNMSALQAKLGETIRFEAQLTTASGVPRPNVRIQFSAVINMQGVIIQLNSTYVNPMVTHTDSQGKARVDITVPADSALGATIEVKAQTRCHWPGLYLDLSDKNQDLIVVDEVFEMTTTCNLCILAYIMVVPESPIGPIAVITAFGAAFAVSYKLKTRSKKH